MEQLVYTEIRTAYAYELDYPSCLGVSNSHSYQANQSALAQGRLPQWVTWKEMSCLSWPKSIGARYVITTILQSEVGFV